MPNINLTDKQIDTLYKYHQDNLGGLSDDVDEENARTERWIEGLSEEEIETIVKN